MTLDYSSEDHNLSRDVASLRRALAEVAASSDVCLRFTFEVEPEVADRKREPRPVDRYGVRVIDPEEYITLLESAKRRLRVLNADRAGISPEVTVAAASIEADIQAQLNAVAETTGFWYPDRLFVDRGETVLSEEGEIEIVEIPSEYVAVGAVELEQMQQLLWAEVEYIEVQIPDPSVEVGTTAAAKAEALLKEIVSKFKEIVRSTVEPELIISATRLSSFQKNWEHALGEITDKTIAGADELLKSLLGFTELGKVAGWLETFGVKLPKQILEGLSPSHRQLLRFVFDWLNRLSAFIRRKLHIDLDLEK